MRRLCNACAWFIRYDSVTHALEVCYLRYWQHTLDRCPGVCEETANTHAALCQEGLTIKNQNMLSCSHERICALTLRLVLCVSSLHL